LTVSPVIPDKLKNSHFKAFFTLSGIGLFHMGRSINLGLPMRSFSDYGRLPNPKRLIGCGIGTELCTEISIELCTVADNFTKKNHQH
jgi:hypothetical protein